MSAPAQFGFEQLVPEIVRGILETVSARPGESEARRFAAQQTAAFSVMAFLPRDAMEAMLAGHCVLYHEVLRDGTHDLLAGQTEQIKLRARPQLAAMGNLFLKTLEQIVRLRARPVEQTAAAVGAVPAVGEPCPERRRRAGFGMRLGRRLLLVRK